MRKIIATITAILLAVSVSSAQEGGNGQACPEITFESMSYNFGTFDYKGKSKATEFRFTNTGTAPLVITRSEVSCSCLSVKYPKKPVMPGESDAVLVTYNPKNTTGKFLNEIKIYSNASNRRIILVVEGEVKGKK